MATVLKILLQQRHLQTLSAFNREYDRLARQVDPDFVGDGPKKAQFYRWLSGEVVSLPYPHHCRILEAMFPGWSAAELLRTHSEQTDLSRGSHAEPAPTSAFISGLADVQAVFPSRTEFLQAMPPRELFGNATRIDMAGLSLNLLCQQYSDTDILRLLDARAQFRCLFLDPEGVNIRHREIEEGHSEGVLTDLTRLNMSVLTRVRRKSSDQLADSLQIRVYDDPIRFNIIIIDNEICVVQPYLPDARGVESPTIIARNSPKPGLFDTFTQVFEAMWVNGKEVAS